MDEFAGLSYKQKISLLFESHLLLKDFIEEVFAHYIEISDDDAIDIHIHLRLLVEDLLADSDLQHLRKHYSCPFESLQDIDPLERITYDMSPERRRVNSFQRKLTELIVRARSPYATDVEPYRTVFENLRRWFGGPEKIGVRAHRALVSRVVRDISSIEHRERPGGSLGAEGGTAKDSGRMEKETRQHAYKCQDTLHITGTYSEGNNSVRVNGEEITLGDSLFMLLLRLVVELKKGHGGWTNTQQLVEEHFLPAQGCHQRFLDLRKGFRGCLRNKNPKDLIENDRRKGYRLSVHPALVTYDKGNLMKSPLAAVKGLAKQLPRQRAAAVGPKP